MGVAWPCKIPPGKLHMANTHLEGLILIICPIFRNYANTGGKIMLTFLITISRKTETFATIIRIRKNSFSIQIVASYIN
jgi:hypothetical protein